jgi:hypothetical protein
MTSQPDEGPGRPEEERPVPVHQDTFRKVYFGQLSDPIYPAPEPGEETPEDDLTRAALSDPDALKGETFDPRPTSWRWVFLLLLAVAALGTVFWKR